MTTEGIREAYRSLSEALTSAGLGWVVHQVEERIREGRPVEKEARIFKDEEPGEQVLATGTDPEAARRPGKPTLMMTLEPWASTWALVFRLVTFNVFVMLVDSATNSRLLRSLSGNKRE